MCEYVNKNKNKTFDKIQNAVKLWRLSVPAHNFLSCVSQYKLTAYQFITWYDGVSFQLFSDKQQVLAVTNIEKLLNEHMIYTPHHTPPHQTLTLPLMNSRTKFCFDIF